MSDTTEPLLREALEHLTADAKVQAGYLRELGTWPSLDELALELEDVTGASESWASPTLMEHLAPLSSKLDQMSGQANAHLWQPEALDGPDWAEVRALARRALSTLNARD